MKLKTKAIKLDLDVFVAKCQIPKGEVEEYRHVWCDLFDFHLFV